MKGKKGLRERVSLFFAFSYILSSIFSILLLSPSTNAFSSTSNIEAGGYRPIFNGNNILFWNPFEDLCEEGYVAYEKEDVLLDEGESANSIFQYLRGQGYSVTSAAAIMGNLDAESGLNPRQLERIKANAKYPGYLAPPNFVAYDFENDHKTYEGGFGLAQWTSPGRVKKLQNHAKSKGMNVTSLLVQLQFLVKELDDYGISPSFLNAKSLEDATEYVLKKYEAPENSDSKVADRIARAKKFLFEDEEDPGGGEITEGDGEVICITDAAFDKLYKDKYKQLTDEEILEMLEDGGMTLAEAKALIAEYLRTPASDFAYYNIDPRVHNGSNSPLYNCVAFSRWFAKKFYGFNITRGNGKDVVSVILGGRAGHVVPKAGAIFSTSSGGNAGHTGVVLGIHGDRIVIGEASYHGVWARAKEAPISNYINKGYTFAYPEDM